MSGVIASTARRERTRQRLLDAAAEVFSEVGLDAASVETVCDRAGFSRGAFYSNFSSKDELFLELAQRVADHKLGAVTDRVRELESGALRPADVGAPGALVGHLLDVENDNRSAVLLMSEIRNRALRDDELARSYTAWEDAMVSRVAGLIRDVMRVSGLSPALPAVEMARMFIDTWESAAFRAAMEGLDHDALCRSIRQRMQLLAEVLVR